MTFIGHPPPGSWRGSPFIRGRRYRVLKEAPSYEGFLAVGEVLLYFGAYVGIYHGVSVYAFMTDLGQERTWMLCDDEPLETWSSFFAPVANAE
jgi:hypothetical protein